MPDTWEQVCRPALARDTATTEDQSCLGAGLLFGWTMATCLRRLSTAPNTGTEPQCCWPARTGSSTRSLSMGSALLWSNAISRCGCWVPRFRPPPSALGDAAAQLHPAVVVVWAQRSATAKTTREFASCASALCRGLSVPIIGTWVHWALFGEEFPGTEIIPRLYIVHVLVVPGLLPTLIAGTRYARSTTGSGSTSSPGRATRR